MGSVAVFLVGAPGVGKTAVARVLLGAGPWTLVLKPKWTVGSGVCAAGHYTGSAFDGADTVPYSGARDAVAYWRSELLPAARLTIFDGDRFSDEGSLERVLAAGVSVRVVLLKAPPLVLAERRAARGSQQNESWMRGRATKAERFAQLDPEALVLAAAATSAELATRMLVNLGRS